MRFSFLIVFSCLVYFLNAQALHYNKYADIKLDFDTIYDINKKRRNTLLISEVSAYTIALVGLNKLWYADYPRSSFHFINDNEEWLQMDKLGHMTASYYAGVAGIQAYKWANMKKKDAIWYGGLTGSFFLTIIEILDGTSKQWGASSGDLLANSFGSFLAIGQALRWDEQRIQLKYSYSSSEWAKYNPEQLGGNILESALKDYNGQTYWISFNLKSVFNITNKKFPPWLSLSIGHSGDNMLGPYDQSDIEKRKRQYLLALDVDLNRVKTNNKTLNTILHTFGFLKFPSPAFEFRNGSVNFHSIYY